MAALSSQPKPGIQFYPREYQKGLDSSFRWNDNMDVRAYFIIWDLPMEMVPHLMKYEQNKNEAVRHA